MAKKTSASKKKFVITFDEEGKPIIEYLDPKFDLTCMKVGSAIRSVAMKDLSYLPTKG